MALAVVVVIYLVLIDSSDLARDEAREAIEGLPYRIAVREADGDTLLGHARGHHGAVVWFAVVRDPDAAGVPAALRRTDPNLSGGGGFWVISDGEATRPHESRAEWKERSEIDVAIEEALCKASTGEACPV